MAMLVVWFEDLKKLAETSPSGYCASHPPLALQRGFKSWRYREGGFSDTLFLLVSLYLSIDNHILKVQNEGSMADQTINGRDFSDHGSDAKTSELWRRLGEKILRHT